MNTAQYDVARRPSSLRGRRASPTPPELANALGVGVGGPQAKIDPPSSRTVHTFDTRPDMNQGPHPHDLYAALGVTPAATPAEITDTQTRLQQVLAAYTLLRDPHRRAIYGQNIDNSMTALAASHLVDVEHSHEQWPRRRWM